MMDIPEDSFAVLVKSPGGYHMRNRSTRPLDPMKPPFRHFLIQPDACDVLQRNAEPALESPHFIHPFHVQMQCIAGEFSSHHTFTPALIFSPSALLRTSYAVQ